MRIQVFTHTEPRDGWNRGELRAWVSDEPPHRTSRTVTHAHAEWVSDAADHAVRLVVEGVTDAGGYNLRTDLAVELSLEQFAELVRAVEAGMERLR